MTVNHCHVSSRSRSNRRDGKPELCGTTLWCSSVSLMHAFEKLGNMGICHRDVKPDNILVRAGVLHLLGAACIAFIGSARA